MYIFHLFHNATGQHQSHARVSKGKKINLKFRVNSLKRMYSYSQHVICPKKKKHCKERKNFVDNAKSIMTIIVVLLSCKPCDKILFNDSIYVNNNSSQHQGSVVHKLNSAINQINHYPVYNAIMVLLIVIYWIAIYPVDITIDPGLHTVFE